MVSKPKIRHAKSTALSDGTVKSSDSSDTKNQYEEVRPAKRMKYRACDSCVTSKTRCDDVLPSGCLVCRKRNKHCSLAELVSQETSRRMSPSIPRSIVEETNAELKNRLEVVEARSWELEQRIKVMESLGAMSTMGGSIGRVNTLDHVTPGSLNGQPPGSSTQGFTPRNEISGGFADQGQIVEVDTNLSRLATRPHNAVFDERILSALDTRGFPCAIQRGLTTPEQVDMAFHVFKHRFSNLVPLAPFLLSSTPTPTHPFLVLAILTHVPTFASRDIFPLVNESLTYVSSGAVEYDVLLALLILSLQPFHRDVMTGWSPVRIIALAYEAGRSLGMESLARSTLKHQERLTQPCWYQALDKLLLWETIKTQYNIMHLTFTANDQLLECHAEKLLNHHVDSYHESIIYLRAWSTFFDSIHPYVQELADAVSEVCFSSFDLHHLFNAWSPVPPTAETFIRQHPRYEFTIRSILFTLSFRTTMHVQAIPTPFFPEHKALGNGWIFEQMLRTAFALGNLIARTPNIREQPKHLIMVGVIALTCVGRVLQFYDAQEALPHHVDGRNIPLARQAIEQMGGAPAMVFRKTTEAFYETREALRKKLGMSVSEAVKSDRGGGEHVVSGHNTSATVDQNDFNMFNLDFASWESLLSAFQPHDNGAVLHGNMDDWPTLG